MSKFADYKTEYNDAECVVEGLVEAGYKKEDIEVHGEAQHLYGYQGDKRKEKANIIVRRKHVGGASNDIGFRREDDGMYTAVISQYDRHKHNDNWMGTFRKGYLAAKQTKEWKAKGFTNIQREVVDAGNGKTRLRLTATPPATMVNAPAQTQVGFSR